MRLAALTAIILVILAVIATLSIIYTAPPSQQPATTTTTATVRPTTKPAPPTAEEVIVSNPPGSGSDTSKTFDPPYVKLVIGVNNTVTWSNDDLIPHTVTSAARLFDYILQPGERRSYTFTKTGLYRYSCTLHPWMTGVVEVVE